MMEIRPSLLKPALSSSTAVSQAGMMLCLFTCTLALLNTSADHSGQRLSAVSEAFEFSLASRGLSLAAEKPDASSNAAYRARNDGPNEKNPIPDRLSSIRRSKMHISERTESEQLTDVNQQSFSRLMVELNRLCDVSAIRSYSGELAFDFVSVAKGTDQEAIDYAIDLMNQIQTKSGSTDLDFELICWADSPKSTSLSLAVQKAATLSDQIRFQRPGKPSPSLSSSGRYWTMTTEIRPAATLVVRKISELSSF